MEMTDPLPSSSHEPFGPVCSLGNCPHHVQLGLQLKRWNNLREQLNCKHESLAELLINSWYANQKTDSADDGPGIKLNRVKSEPQSDSASHSHLQASNEYEMNRISRRKARHMKPTKIPSTESIGTVSLAPKRSIITTKKEKQKSKTLYSFKKVSAGGGRAQSVEYSSGDPVCLKDDPVLDGSLQPRVCLGRFNSCGSNTVKDKEDEDVDSVESKKYLENLDAATEEDEGGGNVSSANLDGDDDDDGDPIGSDFHHGLQVSCKKETAEQAFSESENMAGQSIEGDDAFPETGAVSSQSDWGLDDGGDENDDVAKDSDSDWSPQKGIGTVIKKRKLRRSRRIKVTKPVVDKPPQKAMDGRKTRWQRSRAAASARAAAAAAVSASVSKKDDDVTSFTNREAHSKTYKVDRPKLLKLTPDSFQCQTCKRRFSSKAEGKLHLFEHQPHKCPLCPGRFEDAQVLDRHVTDKHPATQRCSMCFYTCRTKTELRQHVMTQHQLAPLPNTTLCHICGQQFKVTINVQKHLAEVHGIVEESLKKYVCDQCGNEYILKQSFRKHQLTHRGKIIPCSVCDKLFATHDHLRRHYNTVHLKLKKHFCPHEGCDMKFAFRRSLTSHVNMVHLKLRLFPCTWPNCDRKFYAKKHLTVHLRIHNDEKPHKCSICNYACRQRAALNWHMKKHGIYHEPQDDVTKPTYSQFPSNFKRGRKRTRFRKTKPYSMVEARGLDHLVKEEHTLVGPEKQTSEFTDQDKNQTRSSSPPGQTNLQRQFFAEEANLQYPTMVKPISKFQMQFGAGDEYNHDGNRDQSKSYSDDSSIECGARNTSSLPLNGERTTQRDKPDHRLDPVSECPTSSFQSPLHFAGHPAELPKYENPNSLRASTSFQIYPQPHSTATNTKLNYNNTAAKEPSPSSLNANSDKLNSLHYESFEKVHSKVLDPGGVKYSGNVINFSKYEKQYVPDDDVNPDGRGHATSNVKYSENPDLLSARTTGADLFHLNSNFDSSQMNRVKSWINQMHMAGFQYPPSQNCFPGDTEHRLVMRKYMNENESDLRHGMNS
ncbi:uncharacterized protein LOC121389780 [Gigantopelta aegis]|uniref:uncharacterized protein LOC121389780 n=1 Tax=Gigantopelta aegis TaxID=1735272 RepID=UPI001B88BF5A|nr:uncharacterized protein LOC121389780 [Gigantopelta aegis]